jgi:hypothetical protein
MDAGQGLAIHTCGPLDPSSPDAISLVADRTASLAQVAASDVPASVARTLTSRGAK